MPQLRVGTDCSGIEAPIQALTNLGVSFTHEFSSETDPHCVAAIRANYTPQILFGDMMTRDISTVPDIDLYVCGFPCQPFSRAGPCRGLNDDRSALYWECLRVIREKSPTYFVLENVKDLLGHNKGKTWDVMRVELDRLSAEGGYYIHWKVLNTRHYGIPQNRERLFIVGSKSSGFVWPDPVTMPSIHDFVDRTDVSTHVLGGRCAGVPARILEYAPDAAFVDMAFAAIPGRKCSKVAHYAGSLNTRGSMYCIPMQRYANAKELLALQGFREDFKIVTSTTQLKKQVGNTMSVNVLEKILSNLIHPKYFL